jgi:heme/copper-type cytochrome/quinol oxidase subunit 2
MTDMRRMWRGVRIAFFALAGWLAFQGAAWAALTTAPSNPAEKLNSGTYVMAYGLVIFGIALGMLFVCRSSNRRERAKPEQFGESKFAKKEDE